MAKLDDQSVSAVYGMGGANSLPNVNQYQNTNTVQTTQDNNMTAGGTFNLHLNSLLNEDSSNRIGSKPNQLSSASQHSSSGSLKLNKPLTTG